MSQKWHHGDRRLTRINAVVQVPQLEAPYPIKPRSDRLQNRRQNTTAIGKIFDPKSQILVRCFLIFVEFVHTHQGAVVV